MQTEAATKVRDFIFENFIFDEETTVLGNDDSLLEASLLDSTSVLELVFFLEDEFNISVEDEEIIPENLDSISAISAFVASKTAPVSSAA